MVVKFSLGSIAVLLAATAPLAIAAGAVPAPSSSLFGDTVIAKAKTFEVKRSQLDEEVIRIKSQMAAQGRPMPPERINQLEQGVLDQIVSLKLLEARATQADKAKGKELALKRFDEVKNRLGDEDAINMRLKAEQLTKEQLLDKWTQQATAESVVKREVKTDVTDAEVKKFYEENPGRFEQPEMVRASHILLSTVDAQKNELTEAQKAEKRKKAEELLKRARAGEDFAKLAKEFSEDPGSKETGGEYTFPRGRMVPEFEAAAFSLAPGQVSDIVTTQYGYHIIKLHEKLPPKKVEFSTVEENLKEGLEQQAMIKALPDFMKKVKSEAGLVILDERLKLPEPDTNPTGAAAR